MDSGVQYVEIILTYVRSLFVCPEERKNYRRT